jgi:DNA-directed RNA polymerase subunit M/transcription elongation factor TFIIS
MMLFCPTCSNILVISSETGVNKWACNTCPYEFPITIQVSMLPTASGSRLTDWQLTSRTRLERKQIDDVLGGAETWAHADQTQGLPSVLHGFSVANRCELPQRHAPTVMPAKLIFINYRLGLPMNL